MDLPIVGKCASCRHSQEIRSGRGSTFSLCRRSESDSAFVKYPHLPVVDCLGFEARRDASEWRDG